MAKLTPSSSPAKYTSFGFPCMRVGKILREMMGSWSTFRTLLRVESQPGKSLRMCFLTLSTWTLNVCWRMPCLRRCLAIWLTNCNMHSNASSWVMLSQAFLSDEAILWFIHCQNDWTLIWCFAKKDPEGFAGCSLKDSHQYLTCSRGTHQKDPEHWVGGGW